MALTPFEFVVLVLGVYRGARIVSTDTVSEPPRLRMAEWSEGEDSWRAWLYDLIECPFCTSVWLAWGGYVLACVALGRVGDVPLLAHMIEAWGIAGGASILTALDGKLTE
jgi:hypothetical protein